MSLNVLKNITITIAFVGILLLPNISYSQNNECDMGQGDFQGQVPVSFRSHPNNSTFSDNWFLGQAENENGVSFIYLDVRFNQACVGQTVIMSIYEETGINEAVSEFNEETILVGATDNTFYFRPGTEFCNLTSDPDCQYYVQIEYGGDLIYPSGNASAQLQYNAPEITTFFGGLPVPSVLELPWNYFGVANQTNTSGYVFGNFVSSNDPAFINSDGGQSSLGDSDGGQSSLGDSDGGQSNTGFAPETLNCGNSQGVGCIQNPLGSGSNLPSFIENLINIIIQAGIPLVVLALVYSGLRFVLARGNAEKLVEARKVLLWTVVGAAILLGAWTIATIVNETINVFL